MELDIITTSSLMDLNHCTKLILAYLSFGILHPF